MKNFVQRPIMVLNLVIEKSARKGVSVATDIDNSSKKGSI